MTTLVENRFRLPRKYRRTARIAVRWARTTIFTLMTISVLVLVAGEAYKLKRAYNINVVPGVDMLPDHFIEKYIW